MLMDFVRWLGPLIEPVGLLWLLQLGAAAWLFWRRQWRASFILGLLAGLGTLLGSTPLPKIAVASLERPYVRSTLADLPSADVIVTLGGGHSYSAHDVFDIELSEAANRILTAVELARQHKAKALVLSGGTQTVDGQARELSTLLEKWITAWALTDLPVYYLHKITNTQAEAQEVRALAQVHGWKRVILVTSAYHMRRAEAVFRASGFEVIPAACDFKSLGRVETDRVWRPFPELWRYGLWGFYLHEEAGWLLYRLKGYAPSKETPPLPDTNHPSAAPARS